MISNNKKQSHNGISFVVYLVIPIFRFPALYPFRARVDRQVFREMTFSAACSVDNSRM